MNVRSLPKGGFANIEWQGNDYEKWKQILAKLYARREPLGNELQAELTRLRSQYKIDRFYEFN